MTPSNFIKIIWRDHRPHTQPPDTIEPGVKEGSFEGQVRFYITKENWMSWRVLDIQTDEYKISPTVLGCKNWAEAQMWTP